MSGDISVSTMQDGVLTVREEGDEWTLMPITLAAGRRQANRKLLMSEGDGSAGAAKTGFEC